MWKSVQRLIEMFGLWRKENKVPWLHFQIWKHSLADSLCSIVLKTSFLTPCNNNHLSFQISIFSSGMKISIITTYYDCLHRPQSSLWCIRAPSSEDSIQPKAFILFFIEYPPLVAYTCTSYLTSSTSLYI